MQGLSTAEAAKLGGVNVETIRYYERHGLVPKPSRTTAGYRIFTEDAVKRLQFIKHAQELGFSLKEIKELQNLRVKPGGSCADVRNRAQGKIANVDEKIRRLSDIRRALVQLADTCSGRGPISTCTILKALDQGKAL
jgi:MerR family transcriptional regulator, copper efflux regulator